MEALDSVKTLIDDGNVDPRHLTEFVKFLKFEFSLHIPKIDKPSSNKHLIECIRVFGDLAAALTDFPLEQATDFILDHLDHFTLEFILILKRLLCSKAYRQHLNEDDWDSLLTYILEYLLQDSPADSSDLFYDQRPLSIHLSSILKFLIADCSVAKIEANSYQILNYICRYLLVYTKHSESFNDILEVAIYIIEVLGVKGHAQSKNFCSKISFRLIDLVSFRKTQIMAVHLLRISSILGSSVCFDSISDIALEVTAKQCILGIAGLGKWGNFSQEVTNALYLDLFALVSEEQDCFKHPGCGNHAKRMKSNSILLSLINSATLNQKIAGMGILNILLKRRRFKEPLPGSLSSLVEQYYFSSDARLSELSAYCLSELIDFQPLNSILSSIIVKLDNVITDGDLALLKSMINNDRVSPSVLNQILEKLLVFTKSRSQFWVATIMAASCKLLPLKECLKTRVISAIIEYEPPIEVEPLRGFWLFEKRYRTLKNDLQTGEIVDEAIVANLCRELFDAAGLCSLVKGFAVSLNADNNDLPSLLRVCAILKNIEGAKEQSSYIDYDFDQAASNILSRLVERDLTIFLHDASLFQLIESNTHFLWPARPHLSEDLAFKITNFLYKNYLSEDINKIEKRRMYDIQELALYHSDFDDNHALKGFNCFLLLKNLLKSLNISYNLKMALKKFTLEFFAKAPLTVVITYDVVDVVTAIGELGK